MKSKQGFGSDLVKTNTRHWKWKRKSAKAKSNGHRTGNADDEKPTTGRQTATTVESVCDRGRGRNNYIEP